MHYRVIRMLVLVLALAACAAQAWCSVITVAEQSTYDIPYTGAPSDITAAGNLDWVVIDYGEKAGATAIATANGGDTALLPTGPYNAWDPNNGFPTFNWTDSFWIQKPDPASPANAGLQCASPWEDTGEYVTTQIAIPAGSGQLSVWWVYAVAGGVPAFTAAFQDGTTLDVVGGLDARKTVLDFSTDTAQTLNFSMNRNAGIFAMAVSSVPEPGTLALLSSGLTACLSVYIRRKRK
jgi:hypothetical protein